MCTCVHVCACSCVHCVCIRVIVLTSMGTVLLGGGRQECPLRNTVFRDHQLITHTLGELT